MITPRHRPEPRAPRGPRRAGWAALLLGVAVAALGPEARPAVADAEIGYPPTAERLKAVHAAAQRDGWKAHAAPLRTAALRAYAADKLVAAEAWLNASRWAALFAESEADAVQAWIAAMNRAKAGHPNLPTTFSLRADPLSVRVNPDLQAWVLADADFSDQFFRVRSPLDQPVRVLEILNELHLRDPARFRAYARFALALAVVHDVPPPPWWPHGQVPAQVLPRRLAAAGEAFVWWTQQDRAGRTFHKLAKLDADELKFVVDSPAPFGELEWAQSVAEFPLSHLDRAYTMVRYRNDRVANNTMIWTGKAYRLADILGAGGICADQAYFATQAGKARGVPTLLFAGAGNDGRHAWFGFLDTAGKWRLDAGRHAEQRLVTGHAIDPQTWLPISDHALKFLSERFRELPSFRQAKVHAVFAAEYLAGGDARAAGVAARKAVGFERRHQPGWETLIEAARAEKRDARTVEGLLREAAQAFRGFPDLEADYSNRLAESLRARGETSAADEQARSLALKHKGGRSDLSARQAREMVWRSVASQPPAEQVRVFNQTLDTYGRGAGIGFFDEVVVPFCDHLVELKLPADALRAAERARRVLKVEPGSQLDTESQALLKRLRGK